MEDESNCGGTTPTYCRADQFRCGTTCIPNVSWENESIDWEIQLDLFWIGLALWWSSR